MRLFKLSPLAFLVITSVGYSQEMLQENLKGTSKAGGVTDRVTAQIPDVRGGENTRVQFDPIFLNVSSPSSIDLNRFSNGASALPGTYQSDIYVNDELVGNAPVVFVEQSDKSVLPCLSADVLKKINFNYSQLPASFTEVLKSGKPCFSLSKMLPQSITSYDSGAQRLDISIPQAMMLNAARGYVSPELWDSGVPAAILGYNINGYTTHSHGQDTHSAYAGINSGVNLGAWYFRHDGYWNWQQKLGGQYQSINTYVQRDVSPIKGRIVLGESNTPGQVFDTIPFRGAELLSDDRMLPQSQRGYAPDIRGIARTNARVTVRQNGMVIYETTVSPGAFVIDDLYPTGYGGNLDVTVTEADGTVQLFQVPYAALTQLLRPGMHRYNLVAGELNDVSLKKRPAIYQGTYQRGLTNNITGYGGVQVSQDYYSLQLGTAFGSSVGAISADVTQARVHLLGGTDKDGSARESAMSGQSYRLSYSKYIQETNSNFSIAAYRFSTSGYLDFLTAMRSLDAQERGHNSDNIWRPKNKFTVTANQGLPGSWGQLYVTGYTQDYWNHTNSDVQYQLGYSNTFATRLNMVSYNLSVGRVRNGSGDMETSVLLNFSMPLGRMDQSNVPQLNASLSHDSTGRTGEQVGIAGTVGDDYQYSYGVTAMNYNQGTGGSVSMNGQYRGPYTSVSGSYSVGKNYQSSSAGLSGTVLGYQDGIVMTPYTGDTFAIVEAKGAYGAKVSGYPGIKVDPWGHAAVPYLNPYEMNDIGIDPKGLPYDVELQNTSQKVAPYYGAVVRLKYETQKGYPLLITSRLASGKPLPFGADIFDNNGNHVGSVGQMGQVYARVQDEHGQLTVKWGEEAKNTCKVDYSLDAKRNIQKTDALIKLNSVCRAM